MKTHQDEKCCKASSPGRWSCRNKCDGPLECCSGGSGPRSRKSGWNSVPGKKAPISPTIEMTSDLDEDSVVFWSSYERSLLAEHQAVVLNRTPVVQNFNLFQRQLNAISVRFETLHWPGLDFADGDVSKSLWSSVWHASPRLWTVTWGFHLTRNTFVKKIPL